MDPTSSGLVAVITVLIIIISIIVFKMYLRETDFEKAYGESALRLFAEDRTTKPKHKNRNKVKSTEKKKDLHVEKKENRVEMEKKKVLHIEGKEDNVEVERRKDLHVEGKENCVEVEEKKDLQEEVKETCVGVQKKKDVHVEGKENRVEIEKVDVLVEGKGNRIEVERKKGVHLKGKECGEVERKEDVLVEGKGNSIEVEKKKGVHVKGKENRSEVEKEDVPVEGKGNRIEVEKKKAVHAKGKENRVEVEKKRDLLVEVKGNRTEKVGNKNPSFGNDHYVSEKKDCTSGTDMDGKPNHKKLKGKQISNATETKHMETFKNEDPVMVKELEVSLKQRYIPVKSADEVEFTMNGKMCHDEASSIDAGGRKMKKKNRAKRQEESSQDMLKEESKKTEQSVVSDKILESVGEERKIELEKIKPKKGTSSRNINIDKFKARLSTLTELEQDYVTFLSYFLDSTNTEKNKLCEEAALLRKQINDKDRLILQCTDKLTAAEQKSSEIALLRNSLAEEKKKYKIFEQTVRTQMNSDAEKRSYLQRNCDQLQAELSVIKDELQKAQSLIRSTPPPVDIKPYKQQIDLLKTELTSSKNRCSQLEVELNQGLQAMQQMRNESQNQDRQIEHLRNANALLEQRLQDVEANVKVERDAFERKVQNAMQVAEELSAVTSEIRSEMMQHKESAELAIQERENYFEQIQVLNKQLLDANHERESHLNDIAACRKRLSEMENFNKELGNQLQTLQEANAVSDLKCNELEKQVENYQRQLVDIVKDHEKDVVNLNEEIKRVKEEKEKRIQELLFQISIEVAHVLNCRKEVTEFKNQYHENLNRITALEVELARQTTMTCSSDDVPNEKKIRRKYVSGSHSSLESDNIQKEIDKLKLLNEELREKNYNILQISRQQESAYKRRMREMKSSYEKDVQKCQNKTFETMCAVAPSVRSLLYMPSACNLDNFCRWLKDAENIVLEKGDFEAKKSISDSWKNKEKETKLLSRITQLENKVRKYRSTFATVYSHFETIEQKAIMMEKAHLKEISRLQLEIEKHLKMQLDNERERKQELISQASKLYEIIKEPQKQF